MGAVSRRTFGSLVLLAATLRNQPALAANPSLVVSLPSDRHDYGQLLFVDGAGVRIAGPYNVLGMADQKTASKKGNSPRSTIIPYGDTPLGTYQIDGFQPPSNLGDAARHGPHGKIRITPTRGDAKLASEAGRTFLQIHGGVPGPNRQLRPTNGCLRLSDDDMLDLMTAIITRGTPPDVCSVQKIDVHINGVAAPSNGTDDGDPPADDAPVMNMPEKRAMNLP
jgi:hypothetical protein